MYVTLWSNPLTEVTQSRNKWQWLRQRHHSPCWVACFVHTDGSLTWKTIQVIIFQRGKQKNLRWDWLRWDWGSLGWQGFVMFVKHATRDGVISVKAASECQTSHCGSTPVTPLDNRFEADTVWFPRAALFYVVRAPRSVWKHFGQQDTHVSDTRPRCHTCHQPYQNNFTGHKFLLRDNECAVSFSHYGSGTFGGEPGSINFQDGLNKGPWWRHLESYYLGLMNFWRRAVWFMIPNTRANVFLIYRPFTSTLLRPEIFWTSHFQFYLPLIFYAEWLFLSGIFDTV